MLREQYRNKATLDYTLVVKNVPRGLQNQFILMLYYLDFHHVDLHVLVDLEELLQLLLLG